MKRTIVCFLCLLLTLALLFASCGNPKREDSDEDAGKTKTAAKDKDDAESETEGGDSQPPAAPADAVVTELSAYAIAVQPMDHERENEPTFTGLRVGGAFGYATDEVRLNVAVTEKESGETQFDIFLRGVFPSAYVQEGGVITGTLRARLGEKWLFSIHGAPDDDEDYYIYNAADKTLVPLDSASTVLLFFGSRILLHAMTYAEEASESAYLFDWNGTIVTGYIEVKDLTVSGGYLYMLRFYEPIELHRVPVQALADPNGDLTSRKICELGAYDGTFYEEDSLVLQPLAGGYPVTCKLTDAAETVRSLLQTEAPAADGVEESCGAFSVSLPASWEGKYICDSDEDSLGFFYKTSPSDTEGVLLFRIGLSDGPDSLEDPGFGGVGIDYEVCEILKNDRKQYVMVSEPDEFSGVSDADFVTFMDMLRITETIENRLQGINGYNIRLFDYTGLVGEYVGVNDYGAEYRLSVDECHRNLLLCTLYYTNGDVSDSIEDVTVRMFSNGGTLDWAICVDEEADEWTFGSGVFLQEEEGFSMFLSAPGDSWTSTDDYLSMEYRGR